MNNRWYLLGAVFLSSILLGLAGCAIGATVSEPPPVPTAVSYPTITYEVIGSEKPFDLKEYFAEWGRHHSFFGAPMPSQGIIWRGHAFVSITTGWGDQVQYNGVPLPWSYTEGSFQGEFLYISARNLGDQGAITVSIYVDGELLKTSTSNGAYVTATASGYR